MSSETSSTMFELSSSRAPSGSRHDDQMREKQSKPTGSLHLSGARYPRGMNIAPEEVPNRPFFVKIGKDGVLVALRKLDDQLLSVSEDHRLMVSRTQFSLVLQAGRGKMLSSKVLMMFRSHRYLSLISVCRNLWTGSEGKLRQARLDLSTMVVCRSYSPSPVDIPGSPSGIGGLGNGEDLNQVCYYISSTFSHPRN